MGLYNTLDLSKRDNGVTIVGSKLSPFPNCSAIAISHDCYVNYAHRKKGLGSEAHEERIKQAISNDCGLMLCTVNQENVVEKKILINYNWTLLKTFIDPCSENTIELWCKTLPPNGRI